MRWDTAEFSYRTYKSMYTNCTYVVNNLEIIGLSNESFDLSFLSSIQEVQGKCHSS